MACSLSTRYLVATHSTANQVNVSVPAHWFDKLKRREVWLNDYETLDDGRLRIGRYVDRYHDRPHSGLGYRTPNEVARTWEEGQTVHGSAA